jgi:hypothetical protein
MMAGLMVPETPLRRSISRGVGLQNVQVRIGSALGVPPADVAGELQLFETGFRQSPVEAFEVLARRA